MDWFAKHYRMVEAHVQNLGFECEGRKGGTRKVNDEFVGTIRLVTSRGPEALHVSMHLGLIATEVELKIQAIESMMFGRKTRSVRWTCDAPTFELGLEVSGSANLRMRDDDFTNAQRLNEKFSRLRTVSSEFFRTDRTLSDRWSELSTKVTRSRSNTVVPTVLLMHDEPDEALEYIRQNLLPTNLRRNRDTNYVCALLNNYGIELPPWMQPIVDAQIDVRDPASVIKKLSASEIHLYYERNWDNFGMPCDLKEFSDREVLLSAIQITNGDFLQMKALLWRAHLIMRSQGLSRISAHIIETARDPESCSPVLAIKFTNILG